MNTITIDIHDAQIRLLDLLVFINSGNEVIVTQAQTPVIRLSPINNGAKSRVPGLHAGMGWVSDDFDAPLPDEFWTDAL